MNSSLRSWLKKIEFVGVIDARRHKLLRRDTMGYNRCSLPRELLVHGATVRAVVKGGRGSK